MFEQNRKYSEALMLAILAPSDELSLKISRMASQIGSTLSAKDRALSRMGVEVAMELLP